MVKKNQRFGLASSNRLVLLPPFLADVAPKVKQKVKQIYLSNTIHVIIVICLHVIDFMVNQWVDIPVPWTRHGYLKNRWCSAPIYWNKIYL